jgi:hypothetical protein
VCARRTLLSTDILNVFNAAVADLELPSDQRHLERHGRPGQGSAPRWLRPPYHLTLAGTTTTRTVAAAVAPGGRPERSNTQERDGGGRSVPRRSWPEPVSHPSGGPTKPARCATRHQAASALGPVNTCGPVSTRRAFDITQMSRCAPVPGLRSGPSFGPAMPGRRLSAQGRVGRSRGIPSRQVHS